MVSQPSLGTDLYISTPHVQATKILYARKGNKKLEIEKEKGRRRKDDRRGRKERRRMSGEKERARAHRK